MLTFLVLLFGATLCAGAAAAAIADEKRSTNVSSTDETWQAIQSRNGVSARIPFAAPTAPINQPGLVRVYPRIQTPTPPPPVSTAPLHHPAPVEPTPTEGRTDVESPIESPKVSTKKETPMKWGYPQGGFSTDLDDPDALKTLNRLISDGERRKTVLSWAVFGSNGGSIYSEARPTIEEALSNAQ